MPDPAPQQAVRLAVSTEAFSPEHVNVRAPESGEPPVVELQAFVGQIAPGRFLKCYTIQLDASIVVQLGEHLAKEGRRVRAGLIIADPTQIP